MSTIQNEDRIKNLTYQYLNDPVLKLLHEYLAKILTLAIPKVIIKNNNEIVELRYEKKVIDHIEDVKKQIADYIQFKYKDLIY